MYGKEFDPHQTERANMPFRVATYAIEMLVFLVLYYQTAAAPKRYAPLGDRSKWSAGLFGF